MSTNIRTRSIIWWYSLSKKEKDEKYPVNSNNPCYMLHEIEYFYKNHIQEQRNSKINEILNEN